MKLALRVIAFTFVVAAAIGGNLLPRHTALAAVHQASVPGPLPTCNPFTQTCPNTR
jgi:hypothetical protein